MQMQIRLEKNFYAPGEQVYGLINIYENAAEEIKLELNGYQEVFFPHVTKFIKSKMTQRVKINVPIF